MAFEVKEILLPLSSFNDDVEIVTDRKGTNRPFDDWPANRFSTYWPYGRK